jgi:catechol 2,3-dioxygenase-like lactoylglutathione lyase family enzyme
MQVGDILETCLYVDDLVAAETFYRNILGLEVFEHRPDRHVFFRCGQRMLLIFNANESSKLDFDVPPHGAKGPGHVCFAVPEKLLPQWQDHLRAQGIEIEQIVNWPQGGQSLYFRDPSGNSLEIATPRIWGYDEEATIGPRVDS